MDRHHPLLWSPSLRVCILNACLAFPLLVYYILVAISAICERQTRIHFTDGELIGDMTTYRTTDFRQRTSATHMPEPGKESNSGHLSGDMGLIQSFVQAVKEGNKESQVLGEGTSVDDVLRSHLVVFAAEKSRREGIVVDIAKFEMEQRAEQDRRGSM